MKNLYLALIAVVFFSFSTNAISADLVDPAVIDQLNTGVTEQIVDFVPSYYDIFKDLGIMKAFAILTGVLTYLTLLAILSGNHKLGRFLFRYADEVALDEENARNPDPSVHLYARRTLAIVNAARILGFAIVTGCILVYS